MTKALNLGKLIWRQSRDLSILNYANVIVYEIITNQGTLVVHQEKNTQRLTVFSRPQGPLAVPHKKQVDLE